MPSFNHPPPREVVSVALPPSCPGSHYPGPVFFIRPVATFCGGRAFPLRKHTAPTPGGAVGGVLAGGAAGDPRRRRLRAAGGGPRQRGGHPGRPAAGPERTKP